MIEQGAWIDGGVVAAEQGHTFLVHDPATGRAIARVADCTARDAVRAVEAATAVAPAWSAWSARERSDLLLALAASMNDHRAELRDLIVAESGKTVTDADAEVAYAADFFRYFAERTAQPSSHVSSTAGRWGILVERRSVGVALLVTPWNFPAAMVTRKLAPAIAAGATSVVKPAPETPLTALRLAEIAGICGLPPGVCNVVPTRRAAEVVAAVLACPAVRKLSFTGSTSTGRALLHAAADRVLDTTMELGGNAPFLVLDDADLDAAADAAVVAKMRHNAQTCTAADRFIVAAQVSDEFVERMARRFESIVVGDPTLATTQLGPLVHEVAAARVTGLVAEAVERGAVPVVWGEAGPGAYVAPTLLDRVDPQSRVWREEIFGPVAPVVRATSVEEMIALANDTSSGLAGYVCGNDAARAQAIARRLDVGMVGVNTGLLSDPAAPFGGVKESGIGSEGGPDGAHAYMSTRYFAIAT